MEKGRKSIAFAAPRVKIRLQAMPQGRFAQSVALTRESSRCYTRERSFLRGFQQ